MKGIDEPIDHNDLYVYAMIILPEERMNQLDKYLETAPKDNNPLRRILITRTIQKWIQETH